LRQLIAALLCLLSGLAAAQDRPVLTAADALARLKATGTLDGVAVGGDLDVGGLRHPTNGTLLLIDVHLDGRLSGAPEAPLEILVARLGGLRATGLAFQHPVTLERVVIEGRAGIDNARFTKSFACRRCRITGTFSARRARFDEEADFAFSDFAGGADFSAARFRAVAFDGARFAADPPARFDETDVAGPASFAGIDTQGGPIAFRGAAFRDAAIFRGCRLGPAVFSPADRDAPESPFRLSVASIAGTLDFRRCTLAGVDLRQAALRGGARFEAAELTRGLIDLRGLTAGGDVNLRALRAPPGAVLALDAAAAAGITADAALLDAARLSMPDTDTLEALANRARTLGSAIESRRLAFAAVASRAASAEATLADQGNWALQWPTRNSTDLGRPLLIGAVLWLIAFLLVLPRGTLVAVPAASGKASPSLVARVLEPIHHPPAPDGAGQWCPRTPGDQAIAAAGFALALVTKLGPRSWRPVFHGWRSGVIALLWYACFVLAAIVAATSIALVPGLKEIFGALPG
jgi:uncharacterized protein YjbI with pentapeptide repeats